MTPEQFELYRAVSARIDVIADQVWNLQMWIWGILAGGILYELRKPVAKLANGTLKRKSDGDQSS